MGSVLSLCLSLCLSLSVSCLSLSRSAECNERSKRTTAATPTTATTPREKELRKSLFFLTSVCFQLFPKSPKEDTRSTLYIIIALLPRFCASSSLPPLKEESVSEAYSSLRARVLYPFIKSSGNICESAQKAVRGFVYVADLSV